jgi:phage-related protein
MPDYNLGRAHGTIKIDYEKSGAENAREDIEKVGDEATKSSTKIDESTKKSSEDFDHLAQAARQASQSLNFDNASTEQMAASIKKLEKDVETASASAFAARDKLSAAEAHLADVRKRSNATTKDVADAESNVRRAQQQTVNSVQRLEQNTRALGTARQRLNNMPAPKNQTPGIDNNIMRQFLTNLQSINRNTTKSASGINTFGGRLKVTTAAVALLTPQVAGLAVSLATLSGLAGVAAGALAGLGAVGATVATGISGVGNAFKAAAQSQASAGSAAGASAKAQRAAARAIEDAQRSVADSQENLQVVYDQTARAMAQAMKDVIRAQRDLVDAQREAERAQQGLNRARQQALRDLEDMKSALTGGSLDERQAILDVKKAQEDLNRTLADPTANADDIAQATLNLEKQQFALEQTRKANDRLKTDQAAAAAAGVEGSDAVVSAQDGVRNATQSVLDAQESLAAAQANVRQTQVDSQKQIEDATQAVADAQRNLADAYADAAEAASSGGAAQDKLNEAMAKLSPNAQAFVREVMGLKGAWDGVRKSVQDNLFAGLAAEVKPLAKEWFPLLQTGMGKVATGLNGIIKETVAYLHTAEAQQNVAHIFDNTGQAVTNLRTVVRDLLAAFLDIASVGSDFLPDMATGASNAAARFRDFISAAKESGKLREWMQGALDTLGTLWQLLKNLGSIIGSVFSAFDQSGGGALNTLTLLTGELSDFLKTAQGRDALEALGRILAAIGKAYGKVFLSFLDVASDILVAIEPLVVAFADAVGTYLAVALQAIAPVLQLVADVLGFLGPSLGPVIAGVYALNKAIAAAQIVWRALNVVMDQNPFILIAAAIITLALLIIQNWDSISAFLTGVWTAIEEAAKTTWAHIQSAIIDPIVNIWNKIVEVWNTIKSVFSNAGTTIWNNVVSLWNTIKNVFTSAGDAIVGSVRTMFNNVVDFFKRLPGQVWDFVKSLPGKFLQLGEDIVAGILRGLGNLASALWNKLKDAVSSAWDSVLDFFGISSPSKLAAEAGEFIVMGLVRGIDRSSDAAVQAAANMAAAVGNELTGASGTLAMQTDLAANGAGLARVLPQAGTLAAPTATAATAAAVRGGDGAAAGARSVVIQNLTLQVAGNLDPTNPVAFRGTIVRLKEAIRNVDQEYK